MVRPSPAALEAVPPRRWLDRLGAILRLAGDHGVMVLVRGGMERLGDLVRKTIEIAPDADVLVRADAMANLPPHSTVVVCLRREDFGWLNISRPVVRGHRVILFGDAETTLALEQEAFDFYDWISHKIDAPEGPPAFAVKALRSAACARVVAIAWRGGDLDATFREALPGRKLTYVSAAQPYADLVEAMRSKPHEWVAVTDLREDFDVRHAAWATAEAGRYGRTVAIESGQPILGIPAAHASLMPIEEAAAKLSEAALNRPARVAALLSLETETIERAANQARDGATSEQVERLTVPPIPRPPTDRSARRLPPWPERVRQALAHGDEAVAERWTLAWQAASAGSIEATAALARIYAGQSRLEEARRAVHALDQALSGGVTPLQAYEIARAKALYKAACGAWKEALLLATSALQAGRHLRVPISDMESLLSTRAIALISTGQLKEAEQAVRTWTATAAQDERSASYLTTLAELRLAQGDPSTAAGLLASVLDRTKGADSPVRSKLDGMLGESWIAMGRYGDADRMLAAAIQRARRLGQPIRRLLHAHARALLELGRFEEAEREFNLSLSESPGSGDDTVTRQELARALTAQGRLEEAEELLDRALEELAFSDTKPTAQTLAALYEKARIQILRGNTRAASKMLRHVLRQEEHTLGREHSTLIPTLIELGNALVESGQAREAEQILKRARRLAEKHGNSLFIATALSLLAIAQASQDFPHAGDTARKALLAWNAAGHAPTPALRIELEEISASRNVRP